MKANILSAIILLAAIGCNAQDPTVWRNGTDGIYSSTGLLNEWPAEGPEILWSFEELGQGHSSPIIAGDFLYTTGMLEGTGFLFKFDLNGNLVYKKSYGPEYSSSFYGPRGTPVIAGDLVYQISGYGHVYCLKEATAELVWTIDMVNDFGGDTIRWGYNETPLVDGDIIYVTPGGKANNVLALNRFTGDVVWSSKGKGELTAYCTPLLFDHNGRKILATHTEAKFLGIDAKSGELLWSYTVANKWSVHANTPIYYNGSIFFFSGYGKGSGLLKLNDDGSDVSLVWENKLDSRMGGAVLVDGYIYGSGDANRDWRCIDWETGADSYTSDTIAKGVVIAADNKLFCYSDKGELALVNITPEKFDIISKTRVKKGSEQHWAHPIIHKGVLYLRHGKAIIAYRVK